VPRWTTVLPIVAALERHVASFSAEGTASALATVLTLATLSLVLPTA
jgi:Ca2+:H+ antiporter